MGLHHAPAVGQIASLEENAKICSIFGVAVANAEAIEQGDVMLLETVFYDGVRPSAPGKGGTLSTTTLTRILFDDEKEKFIVLTREVSQWLELEKIDDVHDGKSIKSRDEGILADRPSRTRFIKSGGDVRRDRVAEDDRHFQLLFRLDHDPRSVGMASEHLLALSAVLPSQNVKMTGEGLIDFNIRDKVKTLRIQNGPISKNSMRSVESYSFDTVSNFPIRTSFYGESIVDGARSIPNVIHFEWVPMSELNVPVRLKAESFGRYRSFDDEREHLAPMDKEIHLHWFSVNEPIPDEFFDEDILKDSKRFQDLIDPEKSNATRILDVIEKKNLKTKWNDASEKAKSSPPGPAVK